MKTAILVLQGLMMILVAITAFANIGRFDKDVFFFGAITLAGVGFEILGFAVALIAVRTLKKNLTIRVDPREQLVTHGIFQMSRNPIYLGGLLMCTGWTLIFHSGLCALSTVGLAIVLNVKIRMEERALSEKFGDTYRTYRQGTGRWFLFR